MANTSIYAAFERMWQHIVAALGDKSNVNHTHNELQELIEQRTQVQINTWEADD